MSLGHAFDQDGFGCGGRGMLFAEMGEELIELRLVFGGQDAEGYAWDEAMTEVVARGRGFASFGFGTGAALSIDLIGGNLRFCCHMREFGLGACAFGHGACGNVLRLRGI